MSSATLPIQEHKWPVFMYSGAAVATGPYGWSFSGASMPSKQTREPLISTMVSPPITLSTLAYLASSGMPAGRSLARTDSVQRHTKITSAFSHSIMELD